MKLETMIERLANAQKNLEKLNKKLERIKKVEEHNWDDDYNPYMYTEGDAQSCRHDISTTEKKIEALKADIKAEQEKANSRNIPALVEFLKRWQDGMFKFYKEAWDECKQMQDNVKALRESVNAERYGTEEYDAKKAEYDKAFEVMHHTIYGWNIPDENIPYKKHHVEGRLEYAAEYVTKCKTEAEAIKAIKADAKREADAKYDDIVYRTKARIGEIKDASALSIGLDGELNGIIYGTTGAVRVTTIGAGGYNIQRFHFRTLLHDINA